MAGPSGKLVMSQALPGLAFDPLKARQRLVWESTVQKQLEEETAWMRKSLSWRPEVLQHLLPFWVTVH